MSVKVYPVINTQDECKDYIVKINGKEVKTNTARVSAFPFNRRWPGHQREVEQSELIQFVSLASDEALDFEIIPSTPFENVRVRPRSLLIEPECNGGSIRFTLEKPSYFTVEPYGRNRALHVFVDPIFDYGIDANDENVIYYGAGEHDVGVIELKSNQTLYLDEGAVVYASVRAKDAKNIKILGRGILDNSRNKETIFFEVNAQNNTEMVNNAEREHTVQIEYCDDVEIDGITIRDSLVYNIRPIGCRGLSIKNVKIIGCWRYNSDGIDMHNCIKVRISDCFIRTFDDSICVKGFDFYNVEDAAKALYEATYHNGECYDIFRDVLVENCVIWNDWGKALEIGAETRAEEIYDIVFKDCDVIHITGVALDCMNVDYADVHDVTFENINVECDEPISYKPLIQKTDGEKYVNGEPEYTPVTMCAEVRFHHEYSAGGDRRGKNRDITFKNIHYYSPKMPKAKFVGYDETHLTENIIISDLYWNDKPVKKLEGECWDVREFTKNIILK